VHLQAVKAALSIPVIANGNVRDLADAEACLAYTGACLSQAYVPITGLTLNCSSSFAVLIWAGILSRQQSGIPGCQGVHHKSYGLTTMLLVMSHWSYICEVRRKATARQLIESLL